LNLLQSHFRNTNLIAVSIFEYLKETSE